MVEIYVKDIGEERSWSLEVERHIEALKHVAEEEVCAHAHPLASE